MVVLKEAEPSQSASDKSVIRAMLDSSFAEIFVAQCVYWMLQVLKISCQAWGIAGNNLEDDSKFRMGKRTKQSGKSFDERGKQSNLNRTRKHGSMMESTGIGWHTLFRAKA